MVTEIKINLLLFNLVKHSSFVFNNETGIGGIGFHCSGSIINEFYVLTGIFFTFYDFTMFFCQFFQLQLETKLKKIEQFSAAHCINENLLIERGYTLGNVRLGEHDRSTYVDCQNGKNCTRSIDIPIKDLIPHRGYRHPSTLNDIALLRLKYSINFSNSIRPICLPSTDFRNKKYDNFPLTVVGWGETENGKSQHRHQFFFVEKYLDIFIYFLFYNYAGTSSDVKLVADVRGIEANECRNTYKISLNEELQFCAGAIGKSGQGAVFLFNLENSMMSINYKVC